jgi:hypothetical protein
MVAGKVGTGLMGRLATEVVENGVDDVVNQGATTGRVDPKSASATTSRPRIRERRPSSTIDSRLIRSILTR